MNESRRSRRLVLATRALAQAAAPAPPASAPAPSRAALRRELAVRASRSSATRSTLRSARRALEARVAEPTVARGRARAGGRPRATSRQRLRPHRLGRLPRSRRRTRSTRRRGEPLNENRFLVRRARLRLESDQGLVHGALEIDANTINGPQVRPWNAEVSLKWPADHAVPRPGARSRRRRADEPFVIVSAGLLITPFGFEVAGAREPAPVPRADRRCRTSSSRSPTTSGFASSAATSSSTTRSGS